MIFGDQATRLLRDSWDSTQMLAQELYAMITTKKPLEGPALITTVKRDFSAPLQLQPQGDDAFKVTPLTIGGITIVFGSDGVAYTETPDATGSQGPNGGTIRTPVKLPAAALGEANAGNPGRIVSGSGTNYQVALYKNGLSAALTDTVAATAPMITVEGEEIPAGSIVLVVKAGAFYHIMEPVWR
jgi:hypothetical protein